jgi:hypothetical protein
MIGLCRRKSAVLISDDDSDDYHPGVPMDVTKNRGIMTRSASMRHQTPTSKPRKYVMNELHGILFYNIKCHAHWCYVSNVFL